MTIEFEGAALRLARIFCGLSLEEVAEKVNKSRQYLHKLETGQSNPTPELSAELADALSVEVVFFFKPKVATT
nr:helix-turn-helix transcriptional regulator [Marinobacter sp. DS40M8]